MAWSKPTSDAAGHGDIAVMTFRNSQFTDHRVDGAGHALSMPPIIVASVVGILVSLIQALTQIQEQTLSFAIKLIAVAVTIAATAGWLGGEILNYTVRLFNDFPGMT